MTTNATVTIMHKSVHIITGLRTDIIEEILKSVYHKTEREKKSSAVDIFSKMFCTVSR